MVRESHCRPSLSFSSLHTPFYLCTSTPPFKPRSLCAAQPQQTHTVCERVGIAAMPPFLPPIPSLAAALARSE